jgi:hypothetical protein
MSPDRRPLLLSQLYWLPRDMRMQVFHAHAVIPRERVGMTRG